jgi:hypothetical protein
MSCIFVRFAALVAAMLSLGIASVGWGQLDYEGDPIYYARAAVDDPIARLQERLNKGEFDLSYDTEHGYLPSVLEALDVTPSSQVLVFSKTSFQRSRISPRRPRALYFNDDVYLGWVQRGDVIEVSSVDPRQGAVFYTLDQQRVDRPQFTRQTDECLLCHGSSHTGGVPGHFVRSVFPDRSGMPVLSAGTFRTDYTSPIKERWGGWYVTGKHGEQRHMGNVTVTDKNSPEQLDTEAGANIVDLSDYVDVEPYLSQESDIVALMVLEHQVAMHNRITSANYRARFAQRDAKIMNEALGRPADYESESTQQRYASAAEKVLDCLLLVGEETLTDPIRGTSKFAEQFQDRGPFDQKGRSLRHLDLNRRLFKYPCSYLIYSASFEGLPGRVRDRIYQRLWEVLTGQDQSPKYAHLSTIDRQAILDILRETKPQLPAYWTTRP